MNASGNITKWVVRSPARHGVFSLGTPPVRCGGMAVPAVPERGTVALLLSLLWAGLGVVASMARRRQDV